MGKKDKQKKKKKSLPKALPEKFIERTEEIMGPALFREVEKTFIDKPTTFRVNTLKATREEIMRELQEHAYKVTQAPWYKDAFILQNKSKRELTELAMYTDGKIYIQSLASMVPPLVMNPLPGERILDLTAAPGSKTSQIAALMEKKGELIANELNKVRFFRLKHNMETLGVVEDTAPEMTSGEATQKETSWTFTLRMEDGSFLTQEYPEYFDKILVDAPCSGEARFIDGVPKTYGFWNEKKIKRLAYRQQKLLFAAWSALKPGGTLVYSTCTMAPEENEMRIDKLLERLGDEAIVESIHLEGLKHMKPVLEWKKRILNPEVAKTLRIIPTKEIEGFYIAHITKKKTAE